MKRLLVLGGVVISFVATGCGYVDENRRAATIVAQAYLDAYHARDAHAVCRLLAPEVVAAIAAHGTCESAIRKQLNRSYPKLSAGQARAIPHPELNPRFAVAVNDDPARQIVVGRYGSIWRIVDGGIPPSSR